jgi:biotin operon repressor
MTHTASHIRVPRAGSKTARLVDMLGTGTGASLDELVERTGCAPHSVRAAMTDLRKRGYQIKRYTESNTNLR